MTSPQLPRLHPNFAYQAYSVGQSQTPLLVIDNFIEGAEELVDYCQAKPGFDQSDRFYPGQRMLAPRLYAQALMYHLSGLFDAVFQLPPNQLEGAKALYSLVTTPPESLQPLQRLPHIDAFLSGDLACVHYLCGARQGGTSLYRHIQTGLEVVTESSIDGYNQAVIDEGALAQAKGYMNGSNPWYERIAKVDAKFNRLVVYPSNILHSGDIPADFAFNPQPNQGRLTLNTFVFRKRQG